jgi:hypothetical protein
MRRILAVAAAAGVIIAAAPLWADSAAPTGNAADFLDGVHCPNPGTAPNYSDASPTDCYNPNASGTKFSGTLTVVYGKIQDPVTQQSCVYNVFVNLTLQQGNFLVPFTTDYENGVRPHAGTSLSFSASCLSPGENEDEQVRVIIDLIRKTVIPFFYPGLCGGGAFSGQGTCPSFQVKDISNFVSTTGPLSSATSDGFSADVTIAAR